MLIADTNQNQRMCGRIGFAAGREDLLRSYPWLRAAPSTSPRFNIAPSDEIVVVSKTGAQLMPWGIGDGDRPLFNVRSETALKPGRYQRMLLEGRALIPASNFYEWRRVGPRRLPVSVARQDGALLNVAALIGRRHDRPAATVLTTTPNKDIEALHTRMPVILSDDDAAAWVLEELSLDQVGGLLRPCPDGFLTLRPASPLVNDVRNDGPELLNPEALPAAYQLDLLG